MSEMEDELNRASLACKAIVDTRSTEEFAEIMVTLEHVMATVLLYCFKQPQLAAGMLNEGLVPCVEHRMAAYASRSASMGNTEGGLQ